MTTQEKWEALLKHYDYSEDTPLTLDNIIKWVVPQIDWQQIIFQPDGYCGLTVKNELYEADGNPVDALITACYKALIGE